MKRILSSLLVIFAFTGVSLAQTTAPAPAAACTCNPSGWSPASVIIGANTMTVNCGHQFSLKCNDKITIRQEYKCLGNCVAKYSAVLKNAAGVVVQNYPSFTFPWSYQFLAAGNYSLVITPVCGTTKCTPCRYFFTVTCPTACDCSATGWQPFTATVAANPPQMVNCGHQFVSPKGKLFKLDGKYVCKGSCTAKYTAVLKNNVTGAVVQNYPSFTFPWSYTFSIAGNYKLEIIPICGDKKCQPCVFYITVN